VGRFGLNVAWNDTALVMISGETELQYRTIELFSTITLLILSVFPVGAYLYGNTGISNLEIKERNVLSVFSI
jgi:hypothetical protein